MRLSRGLAKVPGDRFASAGEFADAVAGSGPVEEIAAERLRQATARAQGRAAPSAAAPAEPQRTSPPASPRAAPVTHRSGIGVRLRMAGTAIVLLIGAAMAWTRAAGHRSPDPAVARPIIAMTPLVNATGDTALDYRAAGLAEAINGRLAASTRAEVYPRPGPLPTIYAIAAVGIQPDPATLACPAGSACLNHPAMLDASRVAGPGATNIPAVPHSHIITERRGGWWHTVNIRVFDLDVWNEIAAAKSLTKVRELQADPAVGGAGRISQDTPTNIFFFIEAQPAKPRK